MRRQLDVASSIHTLNQPNLNSFRSEQNLEFGVPLVVSREEDNVSGFKKFFFC